MISFSKELKDRDLVLRFPRSTYRGNLGTAVQPFKTKKKYELTVLFFSEFIFNPGEWVTVPVVLHQEKIFDFSNPRIGLPIFQQSCREALSIKGLCTHETGSSKFFSGLVWFLPSRSKECRNSDLDSCFPRRATVASREGGGRQESRIGVQGAPANVSYKPNSESTNECCSLVVSQGHRRR